VSAACGRRFAALVIAGAALAAASLAAPTGRIETVAGSRGTGFSAGHFFGDGGPATAAQLNAPMQVAPLPGGGFLVADTLNNRIRRVSRRGIITTVAGTGERGFGGDGGPATKARLTAPGGVTVLPGGGFLIADSGNYRIRRVSPQGVITTVAGNGPSMPNGGDGGPAAKAGLNLPRRISLTRDGGYLIADEGNARVRYVSRTGKVKTVAGNGGHGPPFREGARATEVSIGSVSGVAALPDGGFLIAGDVNNDRIYRVSRKGIIRVVAGGATAGDGGDGGPARRALLTSPQDVAATADGGFLIADGINARIRYVSRTGRITTVAGTGHAGFAGDGRPATSARLQGPGGVALAPRGGIYIADTQNHRIRFVRSSLRPARIARRR
jgi:NHL repeat-containing protein